MSEAVATGYRQELKRALSVTDLVIFGLCCMGLTAPLGVFGFVYNASDGMVPLVYVLGLVAMIFTALSYNTMAPAFPSAGSVYAYATGGLGDGAGFLGGWALLLDYALVPAMMTVGGPAKFAVAVELVSTVQPVCVQLQQSAIKSFQFTPILSSGASPTPPQSNPTPAKTPGIDAKATWSRFR